MKSAAVFTVGTSIGGAPDAIRKLLETEPSLDVYLIPGMQGDSDTGNPEQSAEEIRQSVTDLPVEWITCQAVPSFNFPKTYEQIRAVVSGIATIGYKSVYVGITGGSNPMVASLFQASMAYLPCQVIPLYVQAKQGEWQANFIASEIRDRVIAEEALVTARSGQIRLAAKLAQRLPEAVASWKYVRRSLGCLANWDDFDYDSAAGDLDQQARKSEEMECNPLLSPLARTVARLAKHARELKQFTGSIRSVNTFAMTASASDWPTRVRQTGVKLVADTLANAQRRIDEGRYTDSVLRSYRAAECAMQMRLLALGIHPSKPDACRANYLKYCPDAGFDVKPLAFWTGLKFLETAGEIDITQLDGHQKDLAGTRNQTYLEHGYVRVVQKAAERSFANSLALCQALLGSEIEHWRDFEMQF